jgi:selenide,water dikinase
MCVILVAVGAGGHSIDSPEPIFGLVVAGIVDPARVTRNSAAKPGDLLLLSKPLGVGVMTTALKKGLLPPEGYTEVCLVCLLELVLVCAV